MKSLRYVTIIALATIVVPFLGIPTGWKQIIFVVMGAGLLVSAVFLKKAIQSCSHQEEDSAGVSFQDSEYVHDVDIEANQNDQEDVEPNPTVSVEDVIKSESFQFPHTNNESPDNE